MRHLLTSASLVMIFAVFCAAAQKDEHLKSQLDVADKVPPPTDPDAFVILYIGDSITSHGFNDDTIRRLGWDHAAGMAATELDKDYVHLFAADVQTLHPNRKVMPYIHNKGGTGSVKSRGETLGAYETLKPDLVVIQLGEHEKQSDGPDFLRANFDRMLKTFGTWKKKPIVLCVGVWNPGGKGKLETYQGWTRQIDTIMSEVCAEHHVPYASMQKHALNPANSGWGTSPGVQWHPNDAGMKAYAAELARMYRRVITPESNESKP